MARTGRTVTGSTRNAKARFELVAPGARHVMLVGDFNDWDPSARRLRRSPRNNGLFVANLELPPGRYEYKFLVDGEWRLCPDAPQSTSPIGSVNSVVEVQPPS